MPSQLWKGHCDGSFREGVAYLGIVLDSPSGERHHYTFVRPNLQSAFEAESAALHKALVLARRHGAKRIRLHSDCLSLICILDGGAKCRCNNSARWKQNILAMAGMFHRIDLGWVPRTDNRTANRLSRLNHYFHEVQA